MSRRDTFAGCHPAVNFLYFALVLAVTMFCLHPAVFFQKMSLGISAFHLIDADAVSHTESVFVGQPLGLHRKAVQRTCHNGKRSVSAFRGLIAELLRKIEQFSERRTPHDVHDPLIILRTFLLKSIRPLLFQPVGEISAADDCDLSPEQLRCLPDARSQLVVHGERKPGETDPHQTVLSVILIQEIQRNHCPVVQSSVPLAQSPGWNIARLCLPRKHGDKLCVIAHPELHLRRPELSEIAFCSLSRRNMKIVGIHH